MSVPLVKGVSVRHRATARKGRVQSLRAGEPGDRCECLGGGLGTGGGRPLPARASLFQCSSRSIDLVPTVCRTLVPGAWEPRRNRTGCGLRELPAGGRGRWEQRVTAHRGQHQRDAGGQCCGNVAGSPPGGWGGFVKHACLRKNKDGLCAHLGGVWLAAGGAGGLASVDPGDGRCGGPGIRGPWQQSPGC